MSATVSIEGPVELVDGTLMLRIPLSVGGHTLAPLAEGIGTIEGMTWSIERGRSDAMAGRTIPHEEAERELRKNGRSAPPGNLD